MKLSVEGSGRVELTPDEVVAALRDPLVLSRAIPGDGGVESTGSRVATVIVTTGIAGTRGTYRARVHVVEAGPERFVLRVAAAGEPGTTQAELTVELHGDGDGTRVDHHASLTLEGRLAGLGRKVLEGAVASGASRFLADLEDAVRAPARQAPPVASPSAAVVAPGSVVAPGDGAAPPGPGGASSHARSSVRTALTAAAAGALATVGALRWWRGRQGA